MPGADAESPNDAQSNAYLKVDPLVNYQYQVSVSNGLDLQFHGFFTDVTGLELEVSTVEYKTFNSFTGMPQTQFIPGRLNPGRVTLKRGMAADTDFWRWCQSVLAGQMHLARATVGVLLLRRTYAPVLLFTLFDAWPSKWSMGSLTAANSEFMIEELTLVFESIEMLQVGA